MSQQVLTDGKGTSGMANAASMVRRTSPGARKAKSGRVREGLSGTLVVFVRRKRIGVFVLGPLGLAETAIEAHEKKIPKDVEEQIWIGVLLAKEFKVSLDCRSIWSPNISTNTLPSCHFIVDDLNCRRKSFGVGFKVSGVTVTTAREHGGRVKEVFLIVATLRVLHFREWPVER